MAVLAMNKENTPNHSSSNTHSHGEAMNRSSSEKKLSQSNNGNRALNKYYEIEKARLQGLKRHKKVGEHHHQVSPKCKVDSEKVSQDGLLMRSLTKSLSFSKLKSRKEQADERIRRVRERAERKEIEEQKAAAEAELRKQERERKHHTQEAKRNRCYTLYMKLGSPTKAQFLKKIKEMPFEHHHVKARHVDLLPWEADERKLDVVAAYELFCK